MEALIKVSHRVVMESLGSGVIGNVHTIVPAGVHANGTVVMVHMSEMQPTGDYDMYRNCISEGHPWAMLPIAKVKIITDTCN